MKKNKIKRQGFTLIEVISVIILLSVLSAVAFSKLSDNTVELVAQTEVVKSHLRFAQLRAMSTEEVWGIHCDGSSYFLFEDDFTVQENKRRFPGENSETVSLSNKNISMDAFTVIFDDWGVPYSSYNDEDDNSRLNSDLNITVSKDGKSKSITITKNTGYIP